MNIYPTQLRLPDPDHLAICWSDGKETTVSVQQLRDQCPCATCREKRSAAIEPGTLPVLRPEQLAPLRIVGMRPVGNYAYSIEFSDGHNLGIYTLEFLRELGE